MNSHFRALLTYHDVTFTKESKGYCHRKVMNYQRKWFS